MTAPIVPAPGRRALLGAGVAGLLLVSTPSVASAPSPSISRPVAPSRSRVRPRSRAGWPFTLGVASGDPTPRGVVLWTRLAPEPLHPDGHGGMPDREVRVDWQVAEDAAFTRVVRRGSVRAVRAWAHSVHVEVDGLAPGSAYHYRFRAEGHVSPAGRTRTAPAAGSSPEALTLAVASCADYEHGFFTGYRRLAEDEPDLVLHLGDYLYELGPDDYLAASGNVREHLGHETRTLADYRQRHAQYKTDPDLQHAHAAVPWAVVFDDHEIDANWAAGVPQVPQRHFARRRAAAFRAYYEHMPLRRTSLPHGAAMRVHRRLRWGDLATIHLLDTRQYRADQACGDTRVVGCAARLDPRRSILGDRQERWLLDGLSASRGTWDLLAQQVFLAQKDSRSGADQELAMDGWDGYAASRRRLLTGLVDRGVRNPVVLTGDVHRHYANDLRPDFDDPSTRPVGVELVTTSITSGGDGRDRTPVTDVQLAENPHLRFANSRRGYVLARLERDHLRADFKTLGYVRRPGAPASVAASFVVEEGHPGLVRRA